MWGFNSYNKSKKIINGSIDLKKEFVKIIYLEDKLAGQLYFVSLF